MAAHLRGPRGGFPPGLTRITPVDDDTGIGLAVLQLRAGETLADTPGGETAYLMMHGTLWASAGGRPTRFDRQSLFDELPSALHVPAGTRVELRAEAPAQLTVYTTASTAAFAPVVYTPADVRDEARGRGQVHDTALRYVRTVFDAGNTAPACQLVLGEVVTWPGRWSSYPPHHHPQPEMYHYRFDRPGGFGHAELGDTVLKVHDGDTVKIAAGLDHPQCAAPGYAMYYAWVIRHLPEARYGVPEFTAEHSWVMQPGARCWWPAKE